MASDVEVDTIRAIDRVERAIQHLHALAHANAKKVDLIFQMLQKMMPNPDLQAQIALIDADTKATLDAVKAATNPTPKS